MIFKKRITRIFKNKVKKSTISNQFNNLGVSLVNLNIIRWISMPLKALIALMILILNWLLIFNLNINLYYTYYIIYSFQDICWIPIIFGGICVITSFSILFKNIHFHLNLWILGKNLKNSKIKRIIPLQLIRIMLFGISIVLSIIVGDEILFPRFRDPWDICCGWCGPPKYNYSLIITLSLLICGLIAIARFLKVISMILLDDWTKNQIRDNPKNEILFQLNAGTNLMKQAAILEILNPFFGYILFNIGLAKTAKGFKNISSQFYLDVDTELANNPLILSSKLETVIDKKKITHFPDQMQNKWNINDKIKEHNKFCSCCGEEHSIIKAKYCHNCGNKFSIAISE